MNLNLLKKGYKTLVLFLILSVFGMLSTSTAFAATSHSFSPASGTFSSTFNVALNFQTNGETTYAIDINVTYAGAISYVSTAAGNAGCNPVVNHNSSNKTVSITCLALQPLSSGTLVTLSFAPSGTGSATLTSTVVDSDVASSGNASASYTITSGGAGGSGTTGTTGGTTGGTLPNTASGSLNLIALGGFAVLFSILTLTAYDLYEVRENTLVKTKENYSSHMRDRLSS